mgnify:CR=1 FL=1
MQNDYEVANSLQITVVALFWEFHGHALLHSWQDEDVFGDTSNILLIKN